MGLSLCASSIAGRFDQHEMIERPSAAGSMAIPGNGRSLRRCNASLARSGGVAHALRPGTHPSDN